MVLGVVPSRAFLLTWSKRCGVRAGLHAQRLVTAMRIEERGNTEISSNFDSRQLKFRQSWVELFSYLAFSYVALTKRN